MTYDELIPYVGALYDFIYDTTPYSCYTSILKEQLMFDQAVKLLPAIEGEAFELSLKKILGKIFL